MFIFLKRKGSRNMISIADVIRRAFNPKEELERFREQKRQREHQYTQFISPEWQKKREEIQERVEESPRALIEQQADRIKREIVDKSIKEPGRFRKELDKLISFVHGMKDPTRQGLVSSLLQFFNDFSQSVRKESPKVSKGIQIDLIEQAEKIADSGKLLSMMADLFSERYEPLHTPRKPRKASIADLIRNLFSL